MNLNKVFIVGRLTQNPELKNTNSGAAVCSFGVATNRYWKNKSGEKQESTEFHNVVAWRRMAEIVSQYLDKGDLILIEGRLQTRSWETPSGNKRRKTEVVATSVQLPPRNMKTGSPQKKKEDDIPVIEEEDVGDIPF